MGELSESAVEAGVWKLVAYCEQAGESSYKRDELSTLVSVDDRIIEQAINCVKGVGGVEAPSLTVTNDQLHIDSSFPPHYGNVLIDQFPPKLDESRWDTAAWRIAFHMNEFATRPFTRRTLRIVAGNPTEEDLDHALSHLEDLGAIERGDDSWRWTQEDVGRFSNGTESINLTWSERLTGTFPPVYPNEDDVEQADSQSKSVED